MMTLPEYLAEHGHSLSPLADPTLLELSPGGGWAVSEIAEAATNVKVWTDPGLHRDGFQPTIIVSAARITPGLDPNVVLDRLHDNAATLPEWHVRASARSTDEQGRLVSDSLGNYRLEGLELTASTLTTVWTEGGSTIIRQVVVTTFSDQLFAHTDALRAAP